MNDTTTHSRISRREYCAWWLLKYAYGIVPLITGVDKFFNQLVGWEKYINPAVVNAVHITSVQAIYAIGIIEILAGILVLKRTQLGAYVVSLWLIFIAFNLISLGMYYDIAARDLLLAVGAYALALLTADLQAKKENPA